MSRLNRIQNEIKQLEGGRFQKLCDMYLYRKYNWENIMSLGSMEGTDKTTIGVPDTYYYDENSNKYILVMFGTRKDSTQKLESDIKEAIEKSLLDEKEIKEIICCHTSSNIKVETDKKLRSLASPIKLTLIGIDSLSQELLKFEYQDIVKEFLGIEQTTEQVWKVNEFVSIHDKSKTNAKLSTPFIGNHIEIYSIIDKLKDYQIFVIKGEPGTGKTRLAVEICNKLQDDSNVISVKSNNLSAYQDIKDALDINRLNYLFLDDANTITSLKAVLDLLLLPEFENNLKIIMTIRDYAFSYIKDQLKSFKVQIYEQKTMDDTHIEKLIKKLYIDIPSHMLTRIKKMSRYNPRLAVLAVEMIKEQGYESINNGKEILVNYYGHIISENGISDNEILTLFVLSFFQKIKLDREETLIDLLNFFEMNYNSFLKSLYILHDKELCDIFQDRATKISDQSLADYIIVDFISNTRRITMRNLFAIFYPKYEGELINLINVINQFDTTETWDDYLKSEIKYVYYEILEKINREKFLNSFAVLLPVESLDFVYNKIRYTDNVLYSISDEEFTKKVNDSNINDPIILILCRLSNSNKMNAAVQLLLQYLNKRQDKVLEVFQAIKEFFNIESEWNHYLFKRDTVIESFKDLKGKSKIASFLFIKVSEEYLKYSGEKTSWDGKNFSIQRYSLVDGEYLINHHRQVLDLLLQIYRENDEDIKNMIETLIMNYPIYEAENDYIQTVTTDLKFIEKNFFPNLEKLTMRQENIVSKLKLEGVNLKLSYIPFSNYVQSSRQMLYNALIAREAKFTLLQLGYDEYEEIRLNKLIETMERYKGNYIKMFNQIGDFINDSIMKNKEREIEESLFLVFSNLNKDKRVDLLRGLFQSNYSIKLYHPKYFMEKLDYNDGVKLLEYTNEDSKEKWKLANLLTNKYIDDDQLYEIHHFINDNEKSKLLSDYSILEFGNFINRDENIINKLYGYYESGILPNNFFIPYFINEEKAKMIVDLVGETIIRKIYLNGLSEQIDRRGILFKMVIDDTFVYNFLVRLHSNVSIFLIDKYGYHLDFIWRNENSEEAIKLYINHLIDENKLIYVGVDPTLKKLFEKNINKSKLFIENEIMNSNSEKYIVNVMNLATEIFSEKVLLEFYNILRDKRIGKEAFESMNFIKLSKSWSGSLVPLLDQEIEFLDSLLEIFNGITFIPHSSILMKRRDYKQKAKEKELLNDYLDEM
ncbi:hypothetical protein GMD78_07335 [Ornithinibacillus sp. L9]|uniref:Novel STAND NTPase 3 domain-containing protein n=1 Tax=Ornithinibacillus caprae TaxID=2678566 RepID=A0A6N8FFJ3_9BACI|nr:hypothetical protein [Ornithinibacillus caprae]MUK88205.1 hypothetical protein [Ornithinibacillus caprae]